MSTSCPSWRMFSPPCFATAMRLASAPRNKSVNSLSPSVTTHAGGSAHFMSHHFHFCITSVCQSFKMWHRLNVNVNLFVLQMTKLCWPNAGIRVGLEFIDSSSNLSAPLLAVLSVPGVQLTNEPALALGQAAKSDFIHQKLFH